MAKKDVIRNGTAKNHTVHGRYVQRPNIKSLSPDQYETLMSALLYRLEMIEKGCRVSGPVAVEFSGL